MKKIIEEWLSGNGNLTDIYYCDLDGWTNLHYAASTNNIEIVRKLLDFGADINAKTKAGNTALHLANLNQYFEITNILIEYGADPTIKNEFNRTSLDYIHNKNIRKKIENLILQYNAYKVAINE